MRFDGSVFWLRFAKITLKDVCYTLQEQKIQVINREVALII